MCVRFFRLFNLINFIPYCKIRYQYHSLPVDICCAHISYTSMRQMNHFRLLLYTRPEIVERERESAADFYFYNSLFSRAHVTSGSREVE